MLTINEISDATGENPETLKKKCQMGYIKGAVKKGKTWLIPDEYSTGGISKPKVGIYIDGANILHGGLKAGWRVDYLKLVNFVKRKYSPTIVSIYDSVGYEKDENGKIIKDASGNFIPKISHVKFLNFLKGKGFRTVTKPLKFIGNDPSKPKNNMDSYLTIDIMKEQDQWDELLLLSGDCDFDRLVDDLITTGKKVNIFSFQDLLSFELRVKAFNSPLVSFTELDRLESIISQPQK